MTVATDRPTPGEVRAARAVAAAGVLVFAGYLFGAVDLSTALDREPGTYRFFLIDTGWGLLFTVLIAVPLLVLAFSPGRPMLLLQVALAGVAIALAAVASLYLYQLLPAAAVLLTAAFATDLSRGRVRPAEGWTRPELDPTLGLLTIVAAPGCLGYAVDMIEAYHEARRPVGITMALNHWPMQAAFALAVPLIGLAVAAGVRQHWAGTLVSAMTVAVSAVWFGWLSVTYPYTAGSLGETAGGAVVGWGVLFGLAAVARCAVDVRPRAATA